MQAIRNIKNNRKAKTRKIKTKKQFDTAKLWAKRSLTFYKGSHITVSIILCATVLFSCVSSSAIAYSKDNLDNLPFDYILTDNDARSYDYYNYTNSQDGITQSEYQQIYSKPYVSEVQGCKITNVNLLVDEYNEIMNAECADDIVSLQLRKINENHNYVKNAEEYKSIYDEGVKSNIYFSEERREYDSYYKYKENLQIGDDKEFYSLLLNGNEDKSIKKIEDKVIDGRIDYDKLSSGEEVILISPQKLEIRMKFYKNGGNGMMAATDDDLSKMELGYKTVVTAECPYKAGDTLELLVANAEVKLNSDNESDYDSCNIKSVKKYTVKIGAIVSPNIDNFYDASFSSFSGFGLMTNIQGINKFDPSSKYYKLNIDTSGELDEEKNIEITEDLEYFKASGNSRWLESNYAYITNQKDNTRILLVAMICATIIGFAICTSIINNSITSKIRENKKVIGMLRTVGADTGALVKSFILQMLSMFGWGIGVGYGVYLLVMLAIQIAKKIFLNWFIELSFNPWFSLGMTALMFIICSINLYAKIKKEMKNSIIENIREL